MNIQNARYADPAHATVIASVDGIEMLIPADAGNRHFARIADLPIEPYTAPPPRVPAAVPRWKARAALRRAGLMAAVEAAVEASDDPVVQEAWWGAVELQRQSPFIAAMAPALGLSDPDIDALFVAAEAIGG